MARVVLTQPAPRVEAIAARLRARGHETLAFALTRIVERDDPALREAVARLGEYDCAILVSPAAVQAAARLAPDWPPATAVALVGPGSRAALDGAGFRRAPLRVLAPAAPPFDGAALSALPPLDAPSGLRVLVLRGERGSDGWIEAMRARGARIDVLAAYRNDPVEPAADAFDTLRRWLDDDAQRVRFVVTQSSLVARLDATLQRAGMREQAKRAPVFAIHARIASALHDAGWRDVRSIEPGEAALVLALESASDSSSRHGA